MRTLGTRTQTTFYLVWGIVWRLAAIGFAFYAAWRMRFIVVIVVMAALMSFIVNPLINRVCLWRPRAIPRASWRFFSTLTVFLTLIFFCIGVALWLWAPFHAQLAGLQQNIGEYQRGLQAQMGVLHQWYLRLPEPLRESLAGEPVAGLANYLFGIAQHIIKSTLTWVQHVWELILIPVLAFYFCWDSRSLKRELMFLVPYRRVRETLFILRHAGQIMENYIIAQVILCIVAGITVGCGLWLLGVPYPLVLGVLAGITRAVPIIGPVLGAIPITLLALTVSMEVGISVLVFFSALHLVESKVLLPQLVGHRIKLHPAIVLIVLLVGAEFFGLLGMLLAAPMAAIGRMLLNLYVVEPEMRKRREAAAGAQSGRAPALAADPVDEALRKVS
ncbi:MAG: AI-2E family transporter [Armatimonadetes bacterium]|nr:AI-2E family transporter [Armatimonadota bacterium]